MIESVRDELERWIRMVRVRRCPVPFVIVFRERSGSTYLCSLLKQHSQISCRTEDFHDGFPDAIDSPEACGESKNWRRRIQIFDGSFVTQATRTDVLRHLYDIFSFPTLASGFKLKFRKQFELFPEILSELKRIRNMRLIVLSRRNVIKQAVSRQNLARIESIAGDANLFGDDDSGSDTLPRFALNIDVALKYAVHSKLEQAAFEDSVNQLTRASGIPTMEVDYNDLLKHHDKTIRQILSFLDVDSNEDLFSNLFQKATPDLLADAITNYDELLKAVLQTELLPMLEEDEYD